jgi:hypothetical protein
VWEILRAPQISCALVPAIVEAGVVGGSGLGERQRYVAREGRRLIVSLAEVTALVPGRVIELTLLNRPYEAARRLELEPVADGTRLSVRSWARAGWDTMGLRRLLQEDDDDYVRRAAQVLPILVQHGVRRIASSAHDRGR